MVENMQRRGLTALADRVEEIVWERPIDGLPRWRRWLIFGARTAFALSRDIMDGTLPMRAMSLVYTTLLSLVPLLAISFSVLKGFGVHNQIEPLLLGLLEPLGDQAAEITERIVSFVDNMRVGVLGGIGFAMLFYTVMALLQKIERSFNYIWHVRLGRDLGQRFRDYLSVILVGPALIFGGIGLTASAASGFLADLVSGLGPAKTLFETAGRLVPYLMIVAAFSFIYSFMPNTKVRLRSALIGGLIAGFLWTTAGWLFASFVAGSANYTAIYSTFASLIVLLLWLYVGWLILLVGAAIAFYHQYPDHLGLGRDEPGTGPRMTERIGLQVAHHVLRCFYQGGPAPTLDALTHRLSLPRRMIEDALGVLCARGLLAKVAESQGYLPGCPPETTSVRDLLDALRSGSDSRISRVARRGHGPADHALAIADRADRAALDSVAAITLKELAGSDAPACPGGGDGPPS